MNTPNKEHVVTEIFYPLGIGVPYLRRTGKPMQCDDPELQTCSDRHFLNWYSLAPIPDDLAGFQAIEQGICKRGDLVVISHERYDWLHVSKEGTPKCGLNLKIYRKIPVASHSHPEPEYRFLKVGEVIQEGDEFRVGNEWVKVISLIGSRCSEEDDFCFRTTRLKIQETNHDPKGEAGKKKPQLQLIPPVLNEELAKALAFGAYHRKEPYGPWNWRKNKVEYMTYIGAMKRHIDCLMERKDIDAESGAHHLGHIAASCAIVLDAGKHGTLVDNRPPQSPNV